MNRSKDFFTNKQIAEQVKRSQKRAIILAIVLGFAVSALIIAVLLVLKFVFNTLIPIGYAFPTIMTAVCAITIGITIPFAKRIGKLRDEQMEEFKDKPVYDKYIKLQNDSRKLSKIQRRIGIVFLVLGFIFSWTLAIIFPYKNYSTVGWLFILFFISVTNLAFLGKQREINTLEKEITEELNDYSF